jgi:hypothetical protein
MGEKIQTSTRQKAAHYSAKPLHYKVHYLSCQSYAATIVAPHEQHTPEYKKTHYHGKSTIAIKQCTYSHDEGCQSSKQHQ